MIKTKVRDYGFIAWLRLQGFIVHSDLTTALTIKELAKLNVEYKQSQFYLFNEELKAIVRSKDKL